MAVTQRQSEGDGERSARGKGDWGPHASGNSSSKHRWSTCNVCCTLGGARKSQETGKGYEPGVLTWALSLPSPNCQAAGVRPLLDHLTLNCPYPSECTLDYQGDLISLEKECQGWRWYYGSKYWWTKLSQEGPAGENVPWLWGQWVTLKNLMKPIDNPPPFLLSPQTHPRSFTWFNAFHDPLVSICRLWNAEFLL